jgi:DNA repair protein RadC
VCRGFGILGTIKSRQLKKRLTYFVPQFALCIVKENRPAFKVVKIDKPEDAARVFRPLRLAAEERFMALHLNVKNEVIGIHEVAHGTLTESLVHPREVFKAALLSNSYALIVCHNHPSGSFLLPSAEDYTATKQLIAAGKILGIAVIDHLIVDGDYSSDFVYSFRQEHPDLWFDEKSHDTI